MKRFFHIITFFIFSLSCYSQVETPPSGYKVWLGTTATPRNAIFKPETWENTAKLVEGLSVNNSPIRPEIGTPSEGEESLTNKQFNQFINTFEIGSENGFIAIPRTHFKNEAFPTRDELPLFLEKKFNGFDVAGYAITGIVFFNNFVGSDSANEVVYQWTEEEVQEMRDWLDTNRPNLNIKLFYIARNFSQEGKDWLENPLVDDIPLEGKPELWYENKGKRQDLLK